VEEPPQAVGHQAPAAPLFEAENEQIKERFYIYVIFLNVSNPTTPNFTTTNSGDPECHRLKGLFTQSDRYKVNFMLYDTFRCRMTRVAQIGSILFLSYNTIFRMMQIDHGLTQQRASGRRQKVY
jgi:hypothetical protein